MLGELGGSGACLYAQRWMAGRPVILRFHGAALGDVYADLSSPWRPARRNCGQLHPPGRITSMNLTPLLFGRKRER